MTQAVHWFVFRELFMYHYKAVCRMERLGSHSYHFKEMLASYFRSSTPGREVWLAGKSIALLSRRLRIFDPRRVLKMQPDPKIFRPGGVVTAACCTICVPLKLNSYRDYEAYLKPICLSETMQNVLYVLVDLPLNKNCYN